MRVQFWGTRGSIPTPGAATVRYGGNTSCVLVTTASGGIIILDCGSGIRPLSHALMASHDSPLDGAIFVTHTHWDHIQGFPFFKPAFHPENSFVVYGPAGAQQSLRQVLAGQMEYSYWPVGFEQVTARMRYVNLEEGELRVGDAIVRAQYLNHPGVTLGYRIEADGAALVYATDHEPFSQQTYRSDTAPGSIEAVLHEGDQRHAAFLAGADLVIHDAQYTREEYRQRPGWGHSPIDYAIDMAIVAGAARLALFHHDPERTDCQLDSLHGRCSQYLKGRGSDVELFFAREGQELVLGGSDTPARVAAELRRGAVAAPAFAMEPARILVVEDDRDTAELLGRFLTRDGYTIGYANTVAAAQRALDTDRPDLVLLDVTLASGNGLDLLKAIRSHASPSVRAIPVVLLTASIGEEATKQAFDLGASDFMAKPFVPALVRARIRGWINRTMTAHGST